MLRSLGDLKDYRSQGTDGEIGYAVDWYLDDDGWVLHYVVVDTGVWIPKRQVVIATSLLGQPEWEARSIPVNLSRAEIQHRADAETVTLRSRESAGSAETLSPGPLRWVVHHEPFMIGLAGAPAEAVKPLLATERRERFEEGPRTDSWPAGALRSAYHASGYMIEAKDGEQTGTLDDFLVDDRRWSLDYLVIDTGQRVGRKRVLVATDWLCNVRDLDRVFRVGLTGDDIRDCPEFDPAAPANVQAEMRRYDYYGRPKGRVGEP